MRHLFAHSLRARLILFVALAIIPVMGLVLYNTVELHSAETQEAQDRAQLIARLAVKSHERLAETARQFLSTLAQLPAIRNRDAAACNAIFGELLNQNPAYTNLGLVDFDGTLLCSALPFSSTTNIRDRVMLPAGSPARNFALSAYSVEPVSGAAAVNIDFPVTDATGQVYAVAFASVNFTWLSAFATEAQLPAGSIVYVIDGNHQLLARYPDADLSQSAANPEIALVQILDDQTSEGTAEATGADGVPRLYGFASFGDIKQASHLRILVGVPRVFAFAKVDQIVRANLLGVGLLSAFMLLLVWLFSDFVVLRQMNALVHTARELSAGNLKARTGPMGKGELTPLVNVFDKMAEVLQQREMERKASEAALRASEEFYQSLVQILPQRLCHKDLEGRFTFANQPYCQALGRALAEIVGKTDYDIHPPELAEKYRADDRRVIETGIPLEQVEEHQIIGGEKKYVQVIKTPVRDANLKITGVQIIFWDITEQKQTEATLRREVDELTAITRLSREITSVPDLHAVFDSIAYLTTELAQSDASGVYTIDDDKRLRIVAYHGVSAEYVNALNGEGVPLGQGVIGQAAAERRIVQIPDVQTEPDYPFRNLAQMEGIHAMIAVPMFKNAELLGGIVLWQRQPHRFTKQEELFLEAAAQQCVNAVENARLLQQTRTRAEQLTLLYDAGLALNSTLDPRVQLQFLFQIAMTALKVDRAIFYRCVSNGVHLEVCLGYTPEDEATLRNLDLHADCEDSLIGSVVANRIVVHLADVSTDSRYVPIDPAVRSTVWAPVEHENRLLGILNVSSKRLNAFTPQDERLLVLFANQAAIALENARLFEELQSSLSSTTQLYGLSGDFLTAGTLADTAHVATAAMRKGFSADAAWINLIDAQGKVEYTYGTGLQGEDLYDIPPRPDGLSSQVWKNGQPLVVHDPQMLHPMLVAMGIQSAILLPLRNEPINLGVLILSYKLPPHFSEREIELLSLFANQTALALRRVRLLAETNRRADQLAVLNHIANAVNQTHTLDDLLKIIHSEITKILPSDASFIALYDAAKDELDLRILCDEGVYSPPAQQKLNAGLSAQVIQNHKPLLVMDVVKETGPQSEPILWGTMKEPRSWLGVPMMIGDTVVGIINVQAYTSNLYSKEDELLLVTIADQAAVALQNARLFEETQRRLAELEAVNRISDLLRRSQSTAEMVPTLLDETLALLDTGCGSVMLYAPERDELVEARSLGWLGLLPRKTLPAREGIAGHVFSTGEIYISHDFATDPMTLDQSRPYTPSGWGGVCLPIRATQEVIGVLFVSVPAPRKIQPSELHLLTTIADICGNAIYRARLYEQTEQRMRRLNALHTISLAISGSLDLRVTLNVLLDQVAVQLGVDAADVLLFNPHTQSLEYAAGRGFRSIELARISLRIGEGFPGRAMFDRRVISIANLAAVTGDLRMDLMARENFVSYFAVPLTPKGQVKGVLEIFHRHLLHPSPEWLDFMEMLANQTAIAIDNATLFTELQRSNVDLVLAYDAAIEGWSRALDLHDHSAEGHTQRVTEMTLRLARSLGINDAELVNIRRGALLHDIGNMGVPDTILLKPGPLTEDEWREIRKHPLYAYEMLWPIDHLRPAVDIPYCHHERWDGSGYPRGLKGPDIPLAARIFAVVDVWDAMRSAKSYRQAWSESQVKSYLWSQAGILFDPQVIKAFLNLLNNPA